MRSPQRNAGPVGFASSCTVKVRTVGKDSSGAATYAYTDIDDIPCTIHSASASEAMKFGPGVAHIGTEVFVGYFPSLRGDGTALSITASTKVEADGTTYETLGAASDYSDGLQRAPLKVVT